MMRNGRKFGVGIVMVLSLGLMAWFATGLPRALKLRALSQTPGILVYADDYGVSDLYRKSTALFEGLPLPDAMRIFFLQYCESRTSRVVLRSLHPQISLKQVKSLKGLEIVSFLDLQLGPNADQIVKLAVERAPNLRILHLQGPVSEHGIREICRRLPELEELLLANATIENAIPELETGLLRLQGLTLLNCDLGTGFVESLENRPDVKIAIQ